MNHAVLVQIVLEHFPEEIVVRIARQIISTRQIRQRKQRSQSSRKDVALQKAAHVLTRLHDTVEATSVMVACAC